MQIGENDEHVVFLVYVSIGGLKAPLPVLRLKEIAILPSRSSETFFVLDYSRSGTSLVHTVCLEVSSVEEMPRASPRANAWSF